MTDVPPTPPATLRRARDIALAEGITLRLHRQRPRHRRRHDPLPGLRQRRVIVRDWHDILSYRLTPDGRCDGVRHGDRRPLRGVLRPVRPPPDPGPGDALVANRHAVATDGELSPPTAVHRHARAQPRRMLVSCARTFPQACPCSPTLSLCRRAAAFVVSLAFVAPSPTPRCPPGVTQGPTHRRHHRVPARQRAHRAAVPRRVEADDHRQRHLPGRLGARELRRDRHGAPARAPGVQGHADARQHHDRARQARDDVQRLDRLGPHQLLRVVHGGQRQPRLGAGDGSRPDGQFVHPQERPRHRDDGRAQRVRERREQPAARALREDAGDRLRVAQLRAHADRRALRHRERRHRAGCRRSTARTTSPTTRC